MPTVLSLEAFFADLQLITLPTENIVLDISPANRADRVPGNQYVSRLPSEIIHAIVLHLVNDASHTAKRALCPCILTCRYWAALLRPTFFCRLTLGSEEDVDALLALASTPSFARPPLAGCLHTIILDIQLPATQRPWWHHASRLRDLKSIAATQLAFRQAGPSWFDRGPAHAMSSGLPRTVPTRALGLTELVFDGLRFASTRDVSSLLGQLPTVQSCTCRRVVFDQAPSAPPARTRPPQETFKVFATQCTIAEQPSGYNQVAANTAVTAALLGAACCPPHDADIWSRALSLTRILFTSYKYDVCMIYLEPGVESPSWHSSNRNIVLEVALSRPFTNAAASVVFCKMSLSDMVPASPTDVLNWCTYAETVLGLEHIAIDEHRTLFIGPDVLEKARARCICTSPANIGTTAPPGARGSRIVTQNLHHGRPVVISLCKGRDVAYRLLIEMKNFRTISTLDQHSPADVDPRVPLPRLVVPQRVYIASERCTYLPTVHFYDNDRPGVLLSRALQDQLGDLVDGDRQVRLSVQATHITVVINWPGYPPWPTATTVVYPSFEADPMTMAQLAHRVAKVSWLFWEDMISMPCEESGWSLDEIEFDQLVLLELRHVSTASWQPVFCRVR